MCHDGRHFRLSRLCGKLLSRSHRCSSRFSSEVDEWSRRALWAVESGCQRRTDREISDIIARGHWSMGREVRRGCSSVREGNTQPGEPNVSNARRALRAESARVGQTVRPGPTRRRLLRARSGQMGRDAQTIATRFTRSTRDPIPARRTCRCISLENLLGEQRSSRSRILRRISQATGTEWILHGTVHSSLQDRTVSEQWSASLRDYFQDRGEPLEPVQKSHFLRMGQRQPRLSRWHSRAQLQWIRQRLSDGWYRYSDHRLWSRNIEFQQWPNCAVLSSSDRSGEMSFSLALEHSSLGRASVMIGDLDCAWFASIIQRVSPNRNSRKKERKKGTSRVIIWFTSQGLRERSISVTVR